MHTGVVFDILKKNKTIDNKVEKFTLLVNERHEEQGALFFVPVEKRDVKILVPAPFHTDLLALTDKLTYNKLLSHQEAFVLK